MKWAFWRRRRPRATGPRRPDAAAGGTGFRSEEPTGDESALGADQTLQLRVRMRRRLIGAAALLLGTAVVVPMMLDRAPPPLPDNIPIDIPSERTPFAPRLSLPASAPRTGAPRATEGKPSSASPAEAPGAKAGVDEPPAFAPGADAPAATAGKPADAQSAKAENWYVQAAALSSESAARQLADRLSKAGMAPFVERTEAAGAVLYRVRLGPFASRDAAVKIRRHLHAMGVGSNVVRVEQAER
ncbi:MAG TPA: SPOR domain-containing protein [Burkholderiaceae bacterium]|jgi:DedD protein|nr:SPOR domain-containing protein [Burkholderiaceae bacterium]